MWRRRHEAMLDILRFFFNPVLKRFFFHTDAAEVEGALWLFIGTLSATIICFNYAVDTANIGLYIIGGICAWLTILIVYCTYAYCKSEFEELMRKHRRKKL